MGPITAISERWGGREGVHRWIKDTLSRDTGFDLKVLKIGHTFCL
jgi:hypothetical protein